MTPHHDRSDHYWRYYPVGRLGEACRASRETIGWMAIGIIPLMVMCVAFGMIAEEGRMGDMSEPVDDLLRSTAGMLMSLGLLAWFTISLASFLLDRAVSRTLVDAALAGAPRTQVPTPEQVKAVIGSPAKPLAIFSLLVGPCLVLFGIMALAAGDLPGLDWAMTVSGVLLIPLGFASLGRFKKAHRARHVQIAAHWTSEHEESAWSRASVSDKNPRRRKGSSLPAEPLPLGHRWRSAASYCTSIGFLLALLASFPFYIGISMRCSGSGSTRGARECHANYYSEPVEKLLGLSWWTFAVAVAIAFLLLVVGQFAHGVAGHLTRNYLRAQVADSAAPRPARSELTAYSDSGPVSNAFAILAAGSISFGLAVQQLGFGHGLGSQEVFAPHRATGMGIAAAGVIMLLVAFLLNWYVSAKSHGLTNDLIRRWPTRAPKGQRHRLADHYNPNSRQEERNASS